MAEQVSARDDVLPATRRWHGDFAPWNRARDRQGRLWVWDWEKSEEDAVAGASTTPVTISWRPRFPGPATGWSGHGLVAAAYAVTVLERALDRRRAGGWDRLWIRAPHLEALADQAGAALAHPA